MNTLSNEEKLDLFFNYLKELEPKDHSPFYRDGLNIGGFFIDKNECEIIIKTFKMDGLIELQSKQSYIITPKGQIFQGYVKNNRKSAQKACTIHKYVWGGIVGFILLATFGMDIFSFVKENTNYLLNKPQSIEKSVKDTIIKYSSDSLFNKSNIDSLKK